jgi:hypothetical protein
MFLRVRVARWAKHQPDLDRAREFPSATNPNDCRRVCVLQQWYRAAEFECRPTQIAVTADDALRQKVRGREEGRALSQGDVLSLLLSIPGDSAVRYGGESARLAKRSHTRTVNMTKQLVRGRWQRRT